MLHPPGALQPLRPPDQHVAPNKGVNHIHHGHEPRPAGLFRPVEGAEEIRLVHVLRRDLGELNAHTLERIARLVNLAQQALRRLDEFWSEGSGKGQMLLGASGVLGTLWIKRVGCQEDGDATCLPLVAAQLFGRAGGVMGAGLF